MDRRYDVNTTDDMFEAICNHLEHATNGGTIKSTITIFRQRQPGKPDLRIWNFFTVAYAGYIFSADTNSESCEKIVGDKSNVALTEVKVYKFSFISVENIIDFILVLSETWLERKERNV